MSDAEDAEFAHLADQLPLPLQIVSLEGAILGENEAYRSRLGGPQLGPLVARALRGGRHSAIRAATAGVTRVVPLGAIGDVAFDAHYFPIRDREGVLNRIGILFVEVRERRVTAPPSRGAGANAEQTLLYILDRMPQLVWSTRPDGYHDFYNRRWYEYTGAQPEETQGAGWNDPLHPDDQERAWKRWKHSLETGEDYEIEYRFRRADGQYRWFLGRALPLRDAEGNIVRWVGTCTDVDDQKKLEEERARVLAQAEANSRMKDEFLATVSHELRTPLTAILGWARMLRMRPELAPKAIEVIERNAHAQAKLIEDVLETSRIITGKVQLSPKRADVNDVVQAAVDTIRPSADAKGVSLEVSLRVDLPRIVCDVDRMQQVVLNLLVNAVKFTPANGVVSVRTFADGDDEVGIDVSDTGAGIPETFLPFVFERFRQADASITRRHGGLGLGLAIVKHLVELHEGKVRAASEGEGKGATFEIRLPVRRASTLAVQERARWSAGSEPSEALRLDHVHVLVVDDERDARELVAMVLREAGATTTEVSSAAAALGAIDRGSVDVIVSDLGMPDVDGYQLLRELRCRTAERGGQLPALALSAFARGEDVERARDAGFQLHLAKPVEPLDLVAAIRHLVASSGSTPTRSQPAEAARDATLQVG